MEVQPVLGLLDDDILRDPGDLGHIVHRLPQRYGGERKGAIEYEVTHAVLVLVEMARRGEIGGLPRAAP